VSVGVAAHITAASPKGPRYDRKLTPRQRKSFDNGIWLCQTCGKAVDSDKSVHTVAQLRGWKGRAEREARTRLGVTKSNSHFQLLPDDQTMYINVRRFHELARRDYVDFNAGPLKPRVPLLALGGLLAAFVMENERALKSLFPEALPLDSLRTKGDVQSVIGKLVQFHGYFRSKNAPRLRKDGSVPIAHASGDIDRDHIVYKDYRRFRLVLPLEPLWFASHSSVAFFRRRIPIRGLARVHSVSRHVVVASPVWLALPSGPLSQQQ
jgi:hypothetical protein